MIPPILLFLLILSVLVFIHELGHFVMAKKNGVDVEEFGLGIPPRVISKKIGKTTYSLNWLPIGGFVKIRGEDYINYDPKDKSNFINKTPFQKSTILLAGVFMNFVLAIVIFYFILGSQGFKSNPILMMDDYKFPYGNTEKLPAVVTFVELAGPSGKSGIQFADKIVSVTDGSTEASVNSVEDLKAYLKDKEGVKIAVSTVNINTDVTNIYEVIPEYREQAGQAGIGVGLGEAVKIDYSLPVQKTFAGFLHSGNIISYSFNMMGSLFAQSFAEKSLAPVSAGFSGPVGIFGAVKSILDYGGDKVFITILDLSAILSLSLGIMNLLPIPALDGGRWMFVLFEWVTCKKVSRNFEDKAHQIGFAFLIGLLLLITAKDLFNL